MAIRAAFAKRFLCTSIFPTQFTAPAASAATATGHKPAPAPAPAPVPVPSTNLFISGLSKRTTTETLNEFASKFGEVVHARVVTDRITGYSKCFGFVNYANLEDAEKGIKGMDAQFLEGWVIFAEYARPKTPQ